MVAADSFDPRLAEWCRETARVPAFGLPALGSTASQPSALKVLHVPSPRVSAERAALQCGDDDVAMLIPTSGSSGTPKLIIVTTAMVLRQCEAPRSAGLRLVL